jgi:hypothetical protein
LIWRGIAGIIEKREGRREGNRERRREGNREEIILRTILVMTLR